MNAIEFVKKFGLDLVKRDVAAWQGGFIKREDFLEHYGFDILDDLKQIVDAWELVERFGGIEHAKNERDFRREQNILQRYDAELSAAINLMEKCL